MTSLIERRPVDIPALMLSQMHDAATQRRHCLPYGMALTRLFRACGVSLEGEIPKEILHTDVYDERSLHRMGFRMVGGRWVRRESGQEPDEEDEIREAEAGPSEPAVLPPVDVPSTQAEHLSPDASAPPPPSTGLSFEEHARAQFSQIRGEVTQLRSEVELLRAHTTSEHAEIRRSMEEGFSRIESLLRSLIPPAAPALARSDDDDDDDDDGDDHQSDHADYAEGGDQDIDRATEVVGSDSDSVGGADAYEVVSRDPPTTPAPTTALVDSTPDLVTPADLLSPPSTRSSRVVPAFGPSGRTRSRRALAPPRALATRSRISAPFSLDVPSDED